MSKQLWQRWQSAIGEAAQASPIFYHRFYDTRSAKGYLPAQPADHLLLLNGHGILLEDKSTEVLNTAEACLVAGIFDNRQLAKHRIWRMRGGSTYITVYYERTNKAELWDSAVIDKRNLEGGSLLHVEPLFVSEGAKTLALHAKSIVKQALEAAELRLYESQR